jgi:hypothetical protein
MSVVEAKNAAPEAWTRLLAARKAYCDAVAPAYDDVLHAVTDRVAQSGSLGKDDIGALLFWKRLRADTRWAKAMHDLPDAQVRSITSEAVKMVNDDALELRKAARKGRSALSSLPGLRTGDALASAILLSCSPSRMAVYDRRAQSGLAKLGPTLTPASGRYSRYMALIDDLLKHRPVSARDWTPRYVDTALFWIGGE